LAELPEEGMAVVMTTPYLEEISHCQRVALLFEGEILMQGDPKRLYQSSGLRAVDFWPKHFLPALQYLETNPKVETYSVRGHAIHLVCSRETSPETGILRSLEQAGIVLDHYQTTEVDIEDLFYLQLQHPQDARVEVLKQGASLQEPAQDFRGEVVVSSENLEKSFRGLQAVKPANFQIQKGEIFGLIGSNGAGKTTLLRMICGLLPPDGGGVKIWGFDPIRDSAQIQSRIGYMSQAFSLYRQLTVRENLGFYGGVYSLEPDYLRERISWILQITGLKDFADRRVGELAQALRQRLALACTLIHDPELIFLDEPTSGVDPVTRRYLWHWISMLAARGCTVVVTTHYMTEAEQCHRVMLMHQGEVLALGRPEEICSAENKKRALFELECQPLKPAIELCQTYPDVHAVVPFGNFLHILTSRERIPVRALARDLLQRGIQLKSLSPIPYSIEDVFVEEISNRETPG